MNTTRRSFFKIVAALCGGALVAKTLVGSQNSDQTTAQLSAKDLNAAFQRTSAAADSASVSFNAFAKQVAAAQETTVRGGIIIGNALKIL